MTATPEQTQRALEAINKYAPGYRDGAETHRNAVKALAVDLICQIDAARTDDLREKVLIWLADIGAVQRGQSYTTDQIMAFLGKK